MRKPYVRSEKLQTLREEGIRKWSELEKRGIKRCCAMLYNDKTKRTRQCRREALSGKSGCCRHQSAFDYADQINKAALEADRKSNEDFNREMSGEDNE